jgi:hypothetical protein
LPLGVLTHLFCDEDLYSFEPVIELSWPPGAAEKIVVHTQFNYSSNFFVSNAGPVLAYLIRCVYIMRTVCRPSARTTGKNGKKNQPGSRATFEDDRRRIEKVERPRGEALPRPLPVAPALMRPTRRILPRLGDGVTTQALAASIN